MQAPEEGALSTYITESTLASEQMLCARMANTIVLPEGALAVENEISRAAVGKIKVLGLNLAPLRQETLYEL